MYRLKTLAFTAVGTLLFGLVAASPSFAFDAVRDADITSWVGSALRQDQFVDSSRVSVSTKDGIVTLTGEVDTLAAQTFADNEAKKIRGVLGVINQIEVVPSSRSDEAIRSDIIRRIRNSAAVKTEDIEVSSIGGMVTLQGNVDSWPEWEEAGILASGVRGVRDVDNELVTRLETVRSDQEIMADAVAALARDVYTTSLPIAVSVRDGRITLTGSVGNVYEKERAAETVRWISNVRGVDNQLDIVWGTSAGVRDSMTVPTSAELQRTVRAALDDDWRLDPSHITVSVTDGDVTLDGRVVSHYERRIAEQDARDVVGVGWVTNNLVTQVDKRSDAAIRGDVQFDLDTDAALADVFVSASSANGNVTLSGVVHNHYQKILAGDLAAGVRGVKRVANDITVMSSNWKRDGELTDEIEQQISWDSTTWPVHEDIGVTVKNGVATLTGNVSKWSQRREAADLALRTPGISKVDNRLTVDGYDYPWDEWYAKGS